MKPEAEGLPALLIPGSQGSTSPCLDLWMQGLKYGVTDSCLHIPAPGVCPPLCEGVSPFSKRHDGFFSFELGQAVYCLQAICYFPGGISLVFIFIG